MRYYFLLFFTLLKFQTYGQSFYFPKDQLKDSISICKSIKSLAQQIAIRYKEKDRNVFLGKQFQFLIAAEHYYEAIHSLDSLYQISISDSAATKGYGLKYYSFVAAKLIQEQKNVTFNEALNESLPTLYNSLHDGTALYSSCDFYCDLKEVKNNFLISLENQKSKDSISFGDAFLLCKTYNLYQIYSQLLPLGNVLITKEDNKKYIIQDSVIIKTRDGGTISATVIRKREWSKQPVILMYNIYSSTRISKEAVVNGYISVVAFTRGKRHSPDEIEPFEHDANDAYDIIDWISKQPWCNGKVGMYGGSYLGFSQWACTKQLHPALKTIVPQVSVGVGVDYPMMNNVFMSYMLQWLNYVTNSKDLDAASFNNYNHWDSVYTKWYLSGKSFRSLDTIAGKPNKIFQRWLQHPSYDDYWQRMAPYKKDFSAINIPVLSTTGYFDVDQLGAMNYFNQHHQNCAKANHYLVIGPYDHNGAQGYISSTVEGYPIDSAATIDVKKLALQWYDYVLKDSSKPEFLKDKINYQVMGSNKWMHASSLSNMNNDTMNFYLNNEKDGKYRVLSPVVNRKRNFIKQEVDFKDRIEPSTYNEILCSDLSISNGVSFISRTFDSSFVMNGSFIGNLNVSINKQDMDVWVHLYELMPDGKYFALSDYLTRASYAKDRTKRQLLKPGKIEEVPINNAYFTSRKISAGSRLIVVVSINKNPYWQINYGTGKDVSDETIDDAKEPLKVKWYNNSVIKVPVYR